MKTPNAYRPLYSEYYTVGYILRYEKNVYDMTEREFVDRCIFCSGGAMNPKRAVEIYELLREEAGL
jgi:hypothetical protein